MSRFVLEFDGAPADVLRVLRQLLKRLGRDHGVKCRAIRPVNDNGSAS